MYLKIPRGNIYQSFKDLFYYFLIIFFFNLNNIKKIKIFEKKLSNYHKVRYCNIFPLARTGIYFVLKNLELPRNTEILMTPITIKAIVDVVLSLGLKPKFIELEKEHLNISFLDLKKKISPRTKVLLITYLFGNVTNIKEIINECKKNKIFVIEDFSHCLNATFDKKKLGTFGDVGVYSLSSIKTLDTFGGGAILTNDNNFNKKLNINKKELLPASRILIIKKILINLIRYLLTNRFIFSFFTYYLIFIYTFVIGGHNIKMLGERDKSKLKSLPKNWFFRYSSFQAHVGLKKIPSITKEDDRRIEIAKHIIHSNKKNITFTTEIKNSRNVFWQLFAFCDDPFYTKKKLLKLGVDSASTSLEYLPGLKNYKFRQRLPVAENIYNKSIFIPCFSNLTHKDVNFINSCLKRVVF